MYGKEEEGPTFSKKEEENGMRGEKRKGTF